MSKDEDFLKECNEEINKQGENKTFKKITRQWIDESIKTNYSYHFTWLGRPIIQYPQDIIETQQLIWKIQPDLIIETGIARGGSLIFYASILELISQCGGTDNSKVLGIDIEIRKKNKEEILRHPMSRRIEMIEGSSTDKDVIRQVKDKAQGAKKVMVCLDSNHTHDHVLSELRLYAPFVSINSYLIVFDTVVEDLPNELIKNRPWSKGNNPKTAVFKYLNELKDKDIYALDGKQLNLEIDKSIDNKLMITVAPSGYLKRR